MDAGRISIDTIKSHNSTLELPSSKTRRDNQDSQKTSENSTKQVTLTLSERDADRLDKLERALEFVEKIPQKISDFEREFNERYVQELQQRFEIYKAMGSAASPKDFLAISRQALNIARDTLADTQYYLGPRIDDSNLLQELISVTRDGRDVTFEINRIV